MGCCQSHPVTLPRRPVVTEGLDLEKVVAKSIPTPEPVIEIRLKCKENHALKWYTDLPFYYFAQTGNYIIRCNLCEISYSCASWHCRQCNYDVCVQCGEKEGMKPLRLLCFNQHELYWFAESGYYNKEMAEELKKVSAEFDCSMCGKTSKGACWNCVKCAYSRCINCGVRDGVYPPEDKLVCDGMHHLDYCYGATNRVACNACRSQITKGGFFHCDEHTYSLCKKCASKRIKESLPHPGFICLHSKPMKLSNIKKLALRSGENIYCGACGSEPRYGFVSEDCLQCYCLPCSRWLGINISKCHTKLCEPNREHNIEWKSVIEHGSFQCRKCQNRFRTGAFTCSDECSFTCINNFSIQE